MATIKLYKARYAHLLYLTNYFLTVDVDGHFEALVPRGCAKAQLIISCLLVHRFIDLFLHDAALVFALFIIV